MRILLQAAALTALISPTIVTAEDLSIRSGLWEMTTTSTNTLMPEPVVTTSEVCVEGNEFDPETMVQDMQDCEVLTSDVTANSMNYEMTCQTEGGEASIKGHYTVNGDEGEGGMTMNMEMGPIVMEFDVDWASVYTGPCP